MQKNSKQNTVSVTDAYMGHLQKIIPHRWGILDWFKTRNKSLLLHSC